MTATRTIIGCNHKWKNIDTYINIFKTKKYVLQCEHCGIIIKR